MSKQIHYCQNFCCRFKMENPKVKKKKMNKSFSAVNKGLDLNKDLDFSYENKEKQKEITAEKTEEKYLYVYGIINQGSFKLNLRGLRNQRVQRIDFGDISALISFYPDLHPVVEEIEAMHHAEILNKLALKTAIIPMAFGTVFKEQEILETVLTKAYPAIKKTLGLIKGKIELGVKVIKKENEDVPGETNKKILEELNKLSVKSLAGDKFSDRLLLNHFFLINKNRFSSFSNKIAELERKYPDLKFLYTGPWPAYSFVNINIQVG